MVQLLVPTIIVEDRDLFSDHSGSIYLLHFKSADNNKEIMFIWAENPTLSHFNDAPIGSLLHDTASGGLMYYHNGATTWTAVGSLT